MSSNWKRPLLVLVPLALVVLAWPSVASAQRHGGRATTRIIVRSGPFYSPFYDPWYGFGWGPAYPQYGGYRTAATIRIDVQPRDAQVYVDGYYAGVVDDFDGAFQRLHVEPGGHEIVVYKEGYRSIRERFYLSVNGSQKIAGDLERLAAGESNEPRPAPVAEAPPTPEQPDRVAAPRPPGRRQTSRRAPDGPARPSPRTTTGSVVLRVQPSDAEIVIDGERWRGAPDDDRLVVQLAEGTHQIEVNKDGYRSVTLDVEVRRGETTPVNVSLARPAGQER